MKIQTKVLVILLSFILITGAATITISKIFSKNIVEQEVYNHLETAAESRANHIETLLNEYKQTAERMATGIHFRNIVDPSKDYDQSIEQINRRINTIMHSSVDISRIRILDKKGIVIASSHTDVGQNKSAAEIFLKGKEGVYIGDIHISNFTGNIVISVAAPILVNGEFSGVLIVNFDAERELFKITTDRTGLGETGEIYLINKDGYMITPSRFVNDTFLKQKVDTSESRERHELSEEEEEVEREEIDIYEDYKGEMVLGTHYKIKETNWCLLAEMDEKEAFAPVTMLTRTLLSILALVLVVGIIFAILVSRTITKPIVKLHHGTEEIEKGNLDYKVGTEARDEIGQLSRAFDDMTADLKKSRAELVEYSKGLEEKVEERTKELGAKVKESEEQVMATLNLLEDVNETKNELDESRLAALNMAQDLDKARQEAERTSEDLEETNIKLERSNRELQDFAYIASHDLREPMRKISAFGQLLQESLKGKLDEDEEENFAFMIDGATRMQQMIDALLSYSRVTTLAKPAKRVDLNKAIGDLKSVELAVLLEETGGTIHVPEPLPAVPADPSQVHQLLQNLIGNGLKFHREGIAPEITVRSKQENNNMVRVEVEDNGIGIEEANYEKIFGMFQRLHSREDYGGTGIGLAVCKKIVERHGGTIGVNSAPDKGSMFWFTLPTITNDELRMTNDKLGGEKNYK